MNTNSENIYLISKKTKFYTFFFSFLIFLVGFIFNFPFQKTIENKLNEQISQIRNCNINYSKMNLSVFLPSINLISPTISGRCISSLSSSINLSKFTLALNGPSFIPFGIRIKTTIHNKKNHLPIYLSQGLSSTAIKIPETKIKSSFVSDLLNEKVYFKGDLLLETIINIEDKKAVDSAIKLKSENLSIPSMTIANFNLPFLKIGNLMLELILDDKNKLKIKTFVIGANFSPIMARATGYLTLNQNKILKSKLNISGSIKFSEEFIEQFSIISMLLASKKQDEGNYQFSLKGIIQSPKFDFL